MIPTFAVGLGAHVTGGGPSGPPPGLPVLAVGSLYVAVLVAGLLAAPLLTGIATAHRRRLPVLALVVVAYSGLAVALLARHEIAVGYVAAGIASVFIGFVSALRRSSADQAIAALGVLGVEAVLAASSDGAGATPFVAVHLVAAAVWVGGVAHIAMFARRAPEGFGRALRRFTPYAVGSAAALVVSGTVLVVAHGLGLAELFTSGFGRVIIAKSVLLASAACLGFAHRTARAPRAIGRRSALVQTEAVALASATALAAVLTGLAVPASATVSAGPGISLVNLGDRQQVGLFAVARDAHSAYLELTSDESLLLGDKIGRRTHQLAPGGVVIVATSAGRSRLRVTSGSSTAMVSLPVDTPVVPPADDSATADRPGWLDYQLGHALAAGSVPTLPVAGPSPCARQVARTDAAAFVAAAGPARLKALRVVRDSSARSRGFVAAVRKATPAATPTVGDHARELLVATGVNEAQRTLIHLARHPAGVDAVYLAPWLLDGNVLGLVPQLRLPQVMVMSAVDPMSPMADRYRAILSGLGGGARPSLAGLLGFASVVAPSYDGDATLQIYSATPVGFLPGVVDVGHNHTDASWFNDGTLVATSAATPLAHACRSAAARPIPTRQES